MSRQTQDHPRVIIFPPVILITTIALGFALQWLMPLGLLATIAPPWRIAVGAAVLAAGVSLCLIGRRALVRRGTNVSPLRPTTALATEGIFQRTRNPLYVGGTTLMVGIALICALDWLLPLIVPSALVLHFGVVLREEQYLERKFGEQYRRYKARVPRYAWPG